MTALTADRDTPRKESRDFDLPMAANAEIFAGAIVCINASNLAVKGTEATGLKAVGRAEAYAKNGAVAGATLVRVRRGTFRYANSASGDAIALKEYGATCYIVDDQTVAKTDNSAARSAAGIVRDVDAAGVWVEF